MGAITETILESLADLAFRPYRIVYGYIPKEYSRRNVQSLVNRLTRSGFIEKQFKEGEFYLRLTQIGLDKLKRNRQSRAFNIQTKKEKWDGLWRVVVFDIPEDSRRIRDKLRETLRILEFRPLQKSVWVGKGDYTKQLRKLITALGIKDFIAIFETRDMGV